MDSPGYSVDVSFMCLRFYFACQLRRLLSIQLPLAIESLLYSDLDANGADFRCEAGLQSPSCCLSDAIMWLYLCRSGIGMDFSADLLCFSLCFGLCIALSAEFFDWNLC